MTIYSYSSLKDEFFPRMQSDESQKIEVKICVYIVCCLRILRFFIDRKLNQRNSHIIFVSSIFQNSIFYKVAREPLFLFIFSILKGFRGGNWRNSDDFDSMRSTHLKQLKCSYDLTITFTWHYPT